MANYLITRTEEDTRRTARGYDNFREKSAMIEENVIKESDMKNDITMKDVVNEYLIAVVVDIKSSFVLLSLLKLYVLFYIL